MKIKLNSDDDSPLKIALQLCNLVVVTRSVFRRDNKYYLQVFFAECLINDMYQLYLLENDRIDISVSVLFCISGTVLRKILNFNHKYEIIFLKKP